MLNFLGKLARRVSASYPVARLVSTGATREFARIALDAEFAAIYAIGDVHGCLGKLVRLETLIASDASSLPGNKLLVRLGDYVDRGEESAGVLDYLSTTLGSPEFKRVSILGNHEKMMLDILDGRMGMAAWIALGGEATMRSYGIDFTYLTTELGMSIQDVAKEFKRSVPHSHWEFLQSLPLSVETAGEFFVHAGVRPGIPWEDQAEDDLLYIRGDFLSGDLSSFSKTIVHGHTPGPAVITERRIGVDTGAHFGGALTAVKITPDGISLLAVN